MDKKSSHVKPIKYPRSNFTILQGKTKKKLRRPNMQGDGFIADKNLFWQKERKKFFTI
jgi:hypothetical protein